MEQLDRIRELAFDYAWTEWYSAGCGDASESETQELNELMEAKRDGLLELAEKVGRVDAGAEMDLLIRARAIDALMTVYSNNWKHPDHVMASLIDANSVWMDARTIAKKLA